MTWADQIDAACERGGGPLRFLDLFRLLRLGQARLWIWPNMHASAILTPDGAVEIFHVFGRWVGTEARELLGNLKAWGQYHGCGLWVGPHERTPGRRRSGRRLCAS